VRKDGAGNLGTDRLMAAQDPRKPRQSGRVRLPPVDSAMNKIPSPSLRGSSEGGKDPLALQPGDPDAAKSRELKDQELLARARKRFMWCVSAESDNRKQALDDLKYKSGEGQWPADVVADRNFDMRPCLTINKLPTFVNQVVNDQRMNRPAININPVGDKSDPEVAKMYRGLIRAIERDSVADIAYDTGFDSAVSMGWGYWWVDLDYESPETLRQKIIVRRIRNAFTVYLDPRSQEPDGGDARFVFVTELIPRKDFEEDWPDADPMAWTEAGFGEDYKEWVTRDEIRIAQYFEIATEKRRVVLLENGHEGFWDELDDAAKRLTVVDERWSDVPRVMRYKLTAVEVLQQAEWPGKYIPMVKVTGNEIDIQGKVRLSGLIRNAKSPQMMYNYNRTLATELTSLQPKAPWIAAEGQLAGHEQEWKQANVKTLPYLLYNPVDINGRPAPPPQRQPFTGPPAAVLAEVEAAAQDMMAVTGIRFDATRGERVYDESGRALRELRERGDLGSFHYIDNFARSLRHTGEIFVDLIPKVYEQKRMLTILREDDGAEQVQADPHAAQPFQEQRNPQSGKRLKIFNPNYGKYGVTVTIGPSYATKRIEAGESMMDFLRAIAPVSPQAAAAVADLVAKNMDWPGAEEVALRLAKMVPPELMTVDGMKDIPPQVQAMLANMQKAIQAAAAEKQQLMAALTERQSDRALQADQIEKTFEAKLLGIVAQVETKMAAVQQKQDEAMMKHVGAPIAELERGVEELRAAMDRPLANGRDGGNA
jgi:hypothetical protein